MFILWGQVYEIQFELISYFNLIMEQITGQYINQYYIGITFSQCSLSSKKNSSLI